MLLYGDEKSYYRQPTLSRDYRPKGSGQPLAYLSYRANQRRRIVGALDALSGQLVSRQSRSINRKVFKEFLGQVRQTYPAAEELYLVLDNWRSVHQHPEVLAEAQQVGITLLFLPTYAPWLNPG